MGCLLLLAVGGGRHFNPASSTNLTAPLTSLTRIGAPWLLTAQALNKKKPEGLGANFLNAQRCEWGRRGPGQGTMKTIMQHE